VRAGRGLAAPAWPRRPGTDQRQRVGPPARRAGLRGRGRAGAARVRAAGRPARPSRSPRPRCSTVARRCRRVAAMRRSACGSRSTTSGTGHSSLGLLADLPYRRAEGRQVVRGRGQGRASSRRRSSPR
jgi:hypothetical protein